MGQSGETFQKKIQDNQTTNIKGNELFKHLHTNPMKIQKSQETCELKYTVSKVDLD